MTSSSSLALPLALAALLATTACGGDDDGGLDASIPDASIPDGSPPDAPPDASDGGPHGGDLDVDSFCHWDCFRSFFCVDGEVHESEHRPIPCAEWTGACGHWPVEAGCVHGCREGVYGDRPEDVCEENVPKRPGDPCAEQAHCEPGVRVEDGFGGYGEQPLDCDAARGECVLRPVESCDGRDDDSDGTVDEGCAASPAIVARPTGLGVYRDAAIGPDRIALLRERSEGPILTIVDPSGATLTTIESGLSYASHVVRVASGFALLRHAHESGPVHEIVVIEDGGGRRTIPIASWPRTRYAQLVPYGADWAILGIGSDSTMPIQVHAADGTRRGTSTLASEWPSIAASTLLTTDELLLVSGQTADRWRVTRVGSVSPIPRGWPTYRSMSEIVALGAERLAVARGDFEHVLVGVDPGGGEWTAPTELGTFPSEPMLARAGDGVLVSWLDGARLRSIALDAARTRTAATVVELGGGEPMLVASGETNAGPRVVLATATGWILVAPLGTP